MEGFHHQRIAIRLTDSPPVIGSATHLPAAITHVLDHPRHHLPPEFPRSFPLPRLSGLANSMLCEAWVGHDTRVLVPEYLPISRRPILVSHHRRLSLSQSLHLKLIASTVFRSRQSGLNDNHVHAPSSRLS